MTYDIVIKDVELADRSDNQRYCIGITGSNIAYVGTEPVEGHEVIDGRDHLAAPGWVNAHTHVAMTLFRLPYALLVGVLIALTALIPIVGAFIGCGVGALLIAVADPWKALVFVVLFLVLQQVEGNLIYPHVVGSSVGLPSIWVLAAVTLGGKLMGVAGMLFFIPLCSVLCALFRDFVKGRLAEKKVPASKWRDPPPPLK